MKNRTSGITLLAVLMTVLLSMAGGLAFAANDNNTKPADATGKNHGDGRMSPELAAKREMVRKQQEQRITNQKRRTAADALKAERLRVYQAKQVVKQSTPASIENKQ